MTTAAQQAVTQTTSGSVTMTYTAESGAARMDQRVSLRPLSPEDALRGLLMTREINANPEEAESLRRSRQQAQEGAVRWLADDETLDDAIDSD